MAKTSSNLKRIEFKYFDGVNNQVASNIGKLTEFKFATNARSKVIGTIEKREAYRRLGNDMTSTANFGMAYFDDANASSTGFYRVSTVSGVTSIYYLNTSGVWTALTGAGTNLSAKDCDFTVAEGCLFVVNGTDANRYVSNDGTTVVTSATATGHLYGSPVAYKINYYKDRLYLGDYTNTTRYKTGIMRSSMPLGIVALVDGDHDQPVTSLKVTDLNYIQTSDSLDLYRGGTKIGDITVTAKNADTNTLTISSFATDIKSADELWVNNTYTGAKVFRWADNPKSGIDVQQYDTFKLTGGDNSSIKMNTNIGDEMVIANSNNLAIWNDYSLTGLDANIGCVSDRGFVKSKTLGALFFMGYLGIYMKTSGSFPKLISSKIQPFWDGTTVAGLEAGAMGAKGSSIFAAVGTVTLYKPDGSTDHTLSNVIVEYNLQQENWYIHTGINASAFYTYQVASSNPDRLEFHGTSGHVYEMFYGYKDNNANEVPFRVDTNDISVAGEIENFAYPQEIIVDADRGSDIKCFVSLDGGDYYEIIGSASKGITIFKVSARTQEGSPARCRTISISLREYSSRAVRLKRMSLTYNETMEEESHSVQYP